MLYSLLAGKNQIICSYTYTYMPSSHNSTDRLLIPTMVCTHVILLRVALTTHHCSCFLVCSELLLISRHDPSVRHGRAESRISISSSSTSPTPHRRHWQRRHLIHVALHAPSPGRLNDPGRVAIVLSLEIADGTAVGRRILVFW